MPAAVPSVQILSVACGSPLHAEQLALRGQVLRIPLGLDPATARHPLEAQALHWVALRDPDSTTKAVVGCVSLLDLGGGDAKLFQMAVDPALQGAGVGRQLVQTFEKEAKVLGFSRVVLHARVSAEGFYARLGYVPVGDRFEEVSIPHIKMVKGLL